MKNHELQKFTVDDSIKAFQDALQRGLDGITEAMEIAAREIAKDASWPDKVEEQTAIPAVSITRWARLIQRQIPQLLIDYSPGARLLSRLPKQLQTKYYSEPLPLLIEKDGGFEVLRVDLRNLTPEQARQVFADDHVRTEAEQRAWIEDRKALSAVPAKTNLPYRIVRDELLVMIPCKFTRRDLARLLSEMEK